MRYPPALLDEIRARLPVSQVVGRRVQLKRAGREFKGLSPFKSEKTPSFHVNRDKGFFHCFGCGVGGDVFKFLELQEKMGFVDAVKQIKAMGISLLIAESNLMTAARVADRLYAIDRGEIIFEGEPKRAFENPDVMKTIRG